MINVTYDQKNGPNIYSYVESITQQLSKGKVTKKRSLFRGMSTMKNTAGRDNKMYFVSDGFNLDEEAPSNQFNNLLQLNGVTSSKSALSMQKGPNGLPSVRSATIQYSNKTPSGKRGLIPFQSSEVLSNINKLSSLRGKNQPSQLGSLFGVDSAERTSAQSRLLINKNITEALDSAVKTTRGAKSTRRVDHTFSPPDTSETRDNKAGSMAEL